MLAMTANLYKGKDGVNLTLLSEAKTPPPVLRPGLPEQEGDSDPTTAQRGQPAPALAS